MLKVINQMAEVQIRQSFSTDRCLKLITGSSDGSGDEIIFSCIGFRLVKLLRQIL